MNVSGKPHTPGALPILQIKQEVRSVQVWTLGGRIIVMFLPTIRTPDLARSLEAILAT